MIAQIIGHIGSDAEKKEANGREYVKFSIADTIKTKDKEEFCWPV